MLLHIQRDPWCIILNNLNLIWNECHNWRQNQHENLFEKLETEVLALPWSSSFYVLIYDQTLELAFRVKIAKIRYLTYHTQKFTLQRTTTNSPCIMCVQYIGGIPWVHWGDTMSTLGGYNEYIGGCSVHRRDIMTHVGGYNEYIGRYHEYIMGISWVHRGMFSTSGFSIEIERFYQLAPPHVSWYPRRTHDISDGTHDIPRCTHGIPPMY